MLVILAGVVSSAFLLVYKHPSRPFSMALSMQNKRKASFSLAIFTFTEAGLALTVVISLILAITQFTLGLGITAGFMTFKAVIFQTLIYGLILAIIFIIWDLKSLKWMG
jgi:hypothetical protein